MSERAAACAREIGPPLLALGQRTRTERGSVLGCACVCVSLPVLTKPAGRAPTDLGCSHPGAAPKGPACFPEYAPQGLG